MSPALRSRLETAWTQSVFDDFLVDEAAQIVRDELARARYLRPAVAVRMVEEGGARILSVEVDRGAIAVRTVVRFEGADAALARGIAARLAERGLVDEAALSPAAVEREVAGYLREAGHLRARVTASAPLFEGEVAVVPVNVDAGSTFSIARVAFEEAERMADDVLRETAALTEGAPYDSVGADAARERLAEMYRLEGFPPATVTVRPDIRTDAPVVDLTFVVVEGARQLLGEVVVAGNRAIAPDVIVRALGLPINTPLRTEDLLRARVRVFDTGLFRRVDVESEPGDPPAGGRPRRACPAAGHRRGMARAALALRLPGEGGASGIRDREARSGARSVGRSHAANAVRTRDHDWRRRPVAAPRAARPRLPRHGSVLRIAHRFIVGRGAIA